MNASSDALAVPIAVAMRRPTLLGVPAMPSLTASLIVRRARGEEAGPLAALLGRAYPTETWAAAATEHELFGDKTIRATWEPRLGGGGLRLPRCSDLLLRQR